MVRVVVVILALIWSAVVVIQANFKIGDPIYAADTSGQILSLPNDMAFMFFYWGMFLTVPFTTCAAVVAELATITKSSKLPYLALIVLHGIYIVSVSRPVTIPYASGFIEYDPQIEATYRTAMNIVALLHIGALALAWCTVKPKVPPPA